MGHVIYNRKTMPKMERYAWRRGGKEAPNRSKAGGGTVMDLERTVRERREKNLWQFSYTKIVDGDGHAMVRSANFGGLVEVRLEGSVRNFGREVVEKILAGFGAEVERRVEATGMALALAVGGENIEEELDSFAAGLVEGNQDMEPDEARLMVAMSAVYEYGRGKLGEGDLAKVMVGCYGFDFEEIHKTLEPMIDGRSGGVMEKVAELEKEI